MAESPHSLEEKIPTVLINGRDLFKMSIFRCLWFCVEGGSECDCNMKNVFAPSPQMYSADIIIG